MASLLRLLSLLTFQCWLFLACGSSPSALELDDECKPGTSSKDQSGCGLSALQLHGSKYGAQPTFDEYVRRYRKGYKAGTPEYEERKAKYEANSKAIAEHNTNAEHTYTRTVNQFTDQLHHELKSRLGYHKGQAWSSGASLGGGPSDEPGSLSDLPEAVSWVDRGATTAVKEQGLCGSCWAFGAVETIESFVAIKTGVLMDLSIEQVLRCAPNPHHCGGTGACAGSTGELALDYVMKAGIASQWTSPYTSYYGDGQVENCTGKKFDVQVTIDSYKTLPSNAYAPVMRVLAEQGPLMVSVQADAWYDYEGGVFDGCGKNGSNVDINHLVQLVGYGTDPVGGDYWMLRNSWGPMWGEKGFIRLKRTEEPECYIDSTPAHGTACEDDMPEFQTVCGMCGILFDTVYPVGVEAIGVASADVNR